MEVKFCPMCGKFDDPKSTVCDCGYVRKKNTARGGAPAHVPTQDEPPLKFNRRRILGLAMFLVLSAAGVLAYFNYPGGSTQDDHEMSSTKPAAEFENLANLAGRPATVNAFEGVVTKVFTGEAITVRDKNNAEYHIRLFGIVAPKLNDEFGIEAKESLSTQILGKDVRVFALKTDESGVIYGRVVMDDKNIGLEQVRNGFAKHNLLIEQPEDESKLYADAEAFAKSAGSGLWSVAETAALPSDPALDAATGGARRSSRPNAAGVSNGERSNGSTPAAGDPKNDEFTNSDEIKPPAAAVVISTEPPLSTPPVVPLSQSSAPRPTVESKPEIQSVPAAAPSERKYIRGPRGGCYYINSSGSKSYVDHSRCQ